MNGQTNTNETTFGRIGPDDALTAIRAENRRAGVTMSSSDEIASAHNLAKALRLDPTTGRTFVVDDTGNEEMGLSASAYIEKLQASAAPTLLDKAELVPVSAGGNRTERAIGMNSALRSTKAHAKAAQALELVASFGNPWRTGNRTHQAFVTNTNPTLAQKLRSTAGQ